MSHSKPLFEHEKIDETTKCRGTHCPIRDECKRFVNIRESKLVSIKYFATAPFDHEKGRCKFFV